MKSHESCIENLQVPARKMSQLITNSTLASVSIMSNKGVGKATNEKPTYFDVVDALTDRFPILFYISDFVKRQLGQPLYPVRIVVLEFTEGKVRKIDFDGEGRESGCHKLQAYLSSPSSECQHRLYIIEDLDTASIKLLGAHLNVDGTVFASQIRDTHFSGGWEHGHQPQLPSFQDPQASFTLRYYEARYFDDGSMPDFSAYMRTSGNLSRRILFGKGRRNKFEGHVGLTRRRNYDGHVGLIRRNTSFWSRIEANGSWNGPYYLALILLFSHLIKILRSRPR
jgi:hypothetical protein